MVRVLWWVITAALVLTMMGGKTSAADKAFVAFVMWIVVGASYTVARKSDATVDTQIKWVLITAALLAFFSFGSDGVTRDWSGEEVSWSDEKPSGSPFVRAGEVFVRVIIACAVGTVAAAKVKSLK